GELREVGLVAAPVADLHLRMPAGSAKECGGRLELERAPVARDRLFRLLQHEQRQAAVSMSVGVVGSQAERTIETRERLRKPLQAMQRDTEVEERFRAFRIERERAFVARARLLEAPAHGKRGPPVVVSMRVG